MEASDRLVPVGGRRRGCPAGGRRRHAVRDSASYARLQPATDLPGHHRRQSFSLRSPSPNGHGEWLPNGTNDEHPVKRLDITQRENKEYFACDSKLMTLIGRCSLRDLVGTSNVVGESWCASSTCYRRIMHSYGKDESARKHLKGKRKRWMGYERSRTLRTDSRVLIAREYRLVQANQGAATKEVTPEPLSTTIISRLSHEAATIKRTIATRAARRVFEARVPQPAGRKRRSRAVAQADAKNESPLDDEYL
jgi:hypothetical protein